MDALNECTDTGAEKRQIDVRQRADCGAKPSKNFTGVTSHLETRTRSVFLDNGGTANLTLDALGAWTLGRPRLTVAADGCRRRSAKQGR